MLVAMSDKEEEEDLVVHNSNNSNSNSNNKSTSIISINTTVSRHSSGSGGRWHRVVEEEESDDGCPSFASAVPPLERARSTAKPHPPEHNEESKQHTSSSTCCASEAFTTRISSSSSSSCTSKRSILTPVTLCILGTETAERFAYFGFRAVLVLYFTVSLRYTETKAIALFSFNSSLAYFSPLLGALLADGGWGRYRVILYFGTVYCVGLALLTLSAASGNYWSLVYQRWGTFAGLFLVCLGTGGIKPCVSAFGADQVYYLPAIMTTADENHRTVSTTSTPSTNETEQLRTEQVRTFFNYFYFCINVGAVTSIALVPMLRSWAGFGLAFAFPCLFMMGAMLLFVSKRSEYRHPPVTASNNTMDNRMLLTFRMAAQLLVQDVFSSPCVSRYCGRFLPSFLSGPRRLRVPTTETLVVCSSTNDGHSDRRDYYHDDDGDKEYIAGTKISLDSNNNSEGSDDQDTDDAQWQEIVDDARQTLHILPVLLMFPIFWTLYDQQGSVWTLQATRMYLPFGMQPEQMNIINPVEILIFVPLFDQIIYPRLEGRGINIRPIRRMAWGMVGAAVAFFLSALVESAIEQSGPHHKVHVVWQLPQITVLAMAEILLSVTGLEFSYAGAPDRLKAAMTALFLSTTAVGDVFSGILYSTVFENMDRSRALHVCAMLMLVNLRLFLWVAHWYEGRQQQQQQQHYGRGGNLHDSRYEELGIGDIGSAEDRQFTEDELELQVLQRNDAS